MSGDWDPVCVNGGSGETSIFRHCVSNKYCVRLEVVRLSSNS